MLHVGGVLTLDTFQYMTTFQDGAYSLSITAVPEPSSFALAGIGLLSTVLLARRRATRVSLCSRFAEERY
jgi:hypothetical protein